MRPQRPQCLSNECIINMLTLWQVAADGANQCAKSKVNKCLRTAPTAICVGQVGLAGWGATGGAGRQPMSKVAPAAAITWLPLDFSVLVTMATHTYSPTDMSVRTRFHFYFYFQLALHRQRAINGNVSHYSTRLRDLNAMAAWASCAPVVILRSPPYSLAVSRFWPRHKTRATLRNEWKRPTLRRSSSSTWLCKQQKNKESKIYK